MKYKYDKQVQTASWAVLFLLKPTTRVPGEKPCSRLRKGVLMKKMTLLFAAFLLSGILMATGAGCSNSGENVPDPPIPPDTPLPIVKNLRVDTASIKIFPKDSLDTLSPGAYIGTFLVRWTRLSLSEVQYRVITLIGTDTVLRLDTTAVDSLRLIRLAPNRIYTISVSAIRGIAKSKEPALITVSNLYQPQHPVSINAFWDRVGSIGVSWTPNSAVQTAQHRIYLRDSVGKIVDSITDTASTRSMVYFPSSPDKKTVLPNRAYMVNIRAFNKIAPGMLCTTFIYDNGSNNDVSFKLPYRYVSTFLSLPPIDSGVMIGITGGIFSMGTIWSKEGLNTIHNCKPVHEVILPSFYLGATEITTTRYAAFLTAQDTALCKVIDTIIIGHTAGIGANDTVFFTTILLAQDTLLQGNRKSIHIVKKDLLFIVDSLLYRNHPVTNITWKGAAAFCNWLSAKNTLNKCYDTAWRYIPGANGYRLPTEAEFEYAHSAAFTGAKQRYPWGYAADESRYASQKNKLGPVGRYLGYFGLFDLSGNVSEWCNDYSDIANPSDSSVYYTECAQKGVVINPLGPTNSAKGHIIRGGSHTGTHNQNCSVWRDASGALSDDRGFRVARNK